ncbi:MAG: hypothetical protein AB1Z57_01065 [Acidimicrobiia bacterium]
MRRFILIATAIAIIGAACAGDTTPTSEDPADGENAMGPGISVEEALASTSTEPVLVNGFLFVSPEGDVTLASALAESFPAQPGGATIPVEGADLAGYEFTESQGHRWTDQPVQVLGVVSDGVLVVAGLTSA